MTAAPLPTVTVGLGQLAVDHGEAVLATLGLGSCVAVLLHDAEAGIGGIVHVVLPTSSLSRDRSNPARFAETAVPALVAEMERSGAQRDRLRARLVGGASMFASLVPQGAVHMGHRNVLACRAALRTAEIHITAEAVGGEAGRSVWMRADTGEATVRVVGREPESL